MDTHSDHADRPAYLRGMPASHWVEATTTDERTSSTTGPTTAVDLSSGLRRVDPARRRGPLYRGYAWLSATRPFAWVSRRIGWKLDPVLLRLTGGRLGAGLLLPTAVLETRGARTGAVRRNALIYFHDGDDVIVMAAHQGLPSHPSWFHNLVATPEVTFGGEPFRASVVEEDVDRLWAAADRVFPPYARYRRQAAESGRTIPLVRLSPRPRDR